MDAASFERVYDSLQEFHAFFAASFGRKQWRDHSGNYLQALLVQDQERRNAENLSESVGISARAMQRFLTEARWSDETVIGRLQEYLAPRLGHLRRRCGCSMAATSPSRAGNRREWPGSTATGGQGGQLPGSMFLAYVSPLGRALVDKRLYLPKSWTSDQDRCAAAGSRRTGGTTGPRRSWPWRCWSGSWSWATSGPSGLPETTPSGCRRVREGLGGPGDALRAGVPGGTTVWPLDPAWTSPEYTGFGPPQPKLRPEAAADSMEQRGDELPDEAWREITVAQGSQGPRTYRFSAQRVRADQEAQARRGTVGRLAPEPGRQRAPLLPVQRSRGHNLGDSGLRGWVRWRIETDRLRRCPTWGDEVLQTRSWAGWLIGPAMCLLGGKRSC